MVATAEKATRTHNLTGGLVVTVAMQRWLTENGNAAPLMELMRFQSEYRKARGAKTYIESLTVAELRDRQAKLNARLDKIADELSRRS